MHQTFIEIKSELEQIKLQLFTLIPSDAPFNVSHNNWSFPSLSKADLTQAVDRCLQLIDETRPSVLRANEPVLQQYPTRLNYMRIQVLPNIWNNPQIAVPLVTDLLAHLEALIREATADPKAAAQDAVKRLRDVQKKLLGVEEALGPVEEKSEKIRQLGSEILDLQEQIETMSSDVRSARQSKNEATKALNDTRAAAAEAIAQRNKLTDLEDYQVKTEERAKKLLEELEYARAGKTGSLLAQSFHDRKDGIRKETRLWVGALVVALCAAIAESYFALPIFLDKLAGADRLAKITIYLFLIAASAIGPVWLAWLATIRIRANARVGEDYAYKAAMAEAFEGYRKIAEGLAGEDPTLQVRLFGVLLQNLDAAPVRLLDQKVHGSPMHALLDSEVVRALISVFPNSADAAKKAFEEKAKEIIADYSSHTVKSKGADFKQEAPKAKGGRNEQSNA